MGRWKTIWKIITPTKALEQSSGYFETLFFESVYRVSYLMVKLAKLRALETATQRAIYLSQVQNLLPGLSTSDHDMLYLLYSTTVKFMITLLVCGEVWYIFTEASSLDEIASSINVTVIQFITVYRYKNMLDHKDIYKKLATSMESPYFDTSNDKRKQLVVFWAKRNEKYLKLLLFLGNCTLVAWYLYPLVDDIEYNLIIGFHTPFTFKTPSRYPVAYFVVVIAFTYISHFVMVTDLIMQAHLIHLLCQFTVLADCFENLLDDCQHGFEEVPRHMLASNTKFAAKYTRRLGHLVEQHKAILKRTLNLRKTLSRPMLGQLAASGILICFIGYQATTTMTESIVKWLMSLFYLGYNSFELYIICLWCEEITTQSQNIGDAIYFSGWECGVTKLPGVRSTIMLVLARANKPLILTAGGMYNLSLTAYTTLVKTSYSALTVLLRFRHE